MVYTNHYNVTIDTKVNISQYTTSADRLISSYNLLSYYIVQSTLLLTYSHKLIFCLAFFFLLIRDVLHARQKTRFTALSGDRIEN